MTIDKQDRLFVPLNTEHYRNFENGTKDVELRGVNNRFNRDTVYYGRTVELRRGYNTDDSLWGTIGTTWVFPTVTKIATAVDHTRILPGAERHEFYQSASELIGGYDEYIAFEVTGL